MIVAVVPAAGSSRRMGRAKLLLPFADTTVLGAVLRALREGGASRVVTVLAEDDRDLQRWATAQPIQTAFNSEPGRGMLSTILCGLQALGGTRSLQQARTTVLICPGDLPALSPDTVGKVIDAVDDGALLAVPEHRGRRGHPLAIAPSLLSEIPGLDPRIGLRQLLQRNPDAVRRVSVDDAGILRDVDTPEDYERLRAEANNQAAS